MPKGLKLFHRNLEKERFDGLNVCITESYRHKQEYAGEGMCNQFKRDVSGLNKLLGKHIKILSFFSLIPHLSS